MARPMTAVSGSALTGGVRVPGDKSISHRALIFGAISRGETEIRGLLEGEDVLATAAALEAMGARIERGPDVWRVVGRGTGGLIAPREPIDFGNTGTGVRLMMGVIAGHDMRATLKGDESLSRRPMGRVLEPLVEMGLEVEGDRRQLPLTLNGSSSLVPISYRLPVASAQVKSAILLAGLLAPGRTSVIEPEATRDHTERMLAHFGGSVDVVDGANGRTITVAGDADLVGAPVAVPGDPSSAAFLVAAALLVPLSEICVENVLCNPTRTGFYETLREMGADVAFENRREQGGEPVADIRVRHSRLQGVTVLPERAPSMIDEYPMLACLASVAQGRTEMRGLAELRVKESDRLAATAAGLKAQGVPVEVGDDTLIVTGCGSELVSGGGRVATELDHRIAMSFLTLGLATRRPVEVDDVTMIATSFPEFFERMGELGVAFSAPGA